MSIISVRFRTPTLTEIDRLEALFNDKCYPELENYAKLMVKKYQDSGYVWKMLGAAYQAQGKNPISSMKMAIRLLPDDADAFYDLGNAFRATGQHSDAIASYRRAVEIKPDYAEAYCNLGIIHATLGQAENSVSSYLRALEIRPDFAEAHSNFGNLLCDLGRHESALTRYRQALKIRPNYAEAYYNLGNALYVLGQLNNAAANYIRALEIKPNLVEAHYNLANTLRDLRQVNDAIYFYHHALKIKPDYAEAHCNLGTALEELGKLDEAAASYSRALEIKPDFTETYSNLLFVLNYGISRESSTYLELARKYGQIVSSKVGIRFKTWNSPIKSDRLRVGLVSGDLLNHPVGYFLEGLLAHINPAKIELIAYSTNKMEDELTARIRPYFSLWKHIHDKSDECAARLIHADGIHILLDLSGHTRYNRLPVFAWKPAPVQVTWLGYFATTGVAEIDYLLGDELSIPEDQKDQFTETIWHLPCTRICFTAPTFSVEISSLPALSTGKITFGCFQNLSKVSDEVLAVWGEIFTAVPSARLRMQCRQLGAQANVERMLERLLHFGISPERVELHSAVPREAYLAAHAEVDLILDTFPFTGGTTTCEALWMGVPTLTLTGDTFLARQGASLLKAAGMEEWVAENKTDYIDKAIVFANDLPKLAAIRDSLRGKVLKTPIFNARDFAKNFEDALLGMWMRWLYKNPNR